MSQLISITVLAPNGRRQTVKVSSNSTILQILEDVCAKQGFDPLEYDIRHHSRILDTTQTVQYCRLPNNAQVEMVKAKSIRKEAEVLISLQLESGERLSGTFLPTEVLWDVISKLQPPLDENKQPSMQYMRQEIRGEENLRNTTLRSLGLTSGRVLFRFMNRPAVDENAPLHAQVASMNAPSQAHPASSSKASSSKPSQPQKASSSAPFQQQIASSTTPTQPKCVSPDLPSLPKRSSPSPPPLPPYPKFESQKSNAKAPETNRSSPPPAAKSPVPHSPEKSQAGPSQSPEAFNTKRPDSLEHKILAEIRERKASNKQLNTKIVESEKAVGTKSPAQSLSGTASKKSVSRLDSLRAIKTGEPSKKSCVHPSTAITAINIPEEPSEASLLGAFERDPMVYNRAMQRHISSEDLPDEFFELTIDDVKYLYRDIKSRASNVDEIPLQTSALRKLEDSKRVLNQLHRYKRTVLRIEFPDQNILQGTFSSVETVDNVYEFVREYLEDPTIPFYLYTTPPKNILPTSAKLIEANCVPCAVLHFGIHGSCQEQSHFLKQKVLSQLTSLEKASAAALRARGLGVSATNDPTIASTSGVPKERKDKPSETCGNESSAKVEGNPNGKVPKWFKLAPK